MNKHISLKHTIDPEYTCKECNFQGIAETELNKHISLKHTARSPYTCMFCDFQVTEEKELNTHVSSKHSTRSPQDNNIKCRHCGSEFQNKWDLMNHRKKEHLNSVAACRNNSNGNCTYSADLCWWKHNENIKQNIECFVCGEMFDCRSSMMMHRKISHASIITACKLFEEQKCRFEDKSCWFTHKNNKNEENESVFRHVLKKTEPPIKSQ